MVAQSASRSRMRLPAANQRPTETGRGERWPPLQGRGIGAMAGLVWDEVEEAAVATRAAKPSGML